MLRAFLLNVAGSCVIFIYIPALRYTSRVAGSASRHSILTCITIFAAAVKASSRNYRRWQARKLFAFLACGRLRAADRHPRYRGHIIIPHACVPPPHLYSRQIFLVARGALAAMNIEKKRHQKKRTGQSWRKTINHRFLSST